VFISASVCECALRSVHTHLCILKRLLAEYLRMRWKKFHQTSVKESYAAKKN